MLRPTGDIGRARRLNFLTGRARARHAPCQQDATPRPIGDIGQHRRLNFSLGLRARVRDFRPANRAVVVRPTGHIAHFHVWGFGTFGTGYTRARLPACQQADHGPPRRKHRSLLCLHSSYFRRGYTREASALHAGRSWPSQQGTSLTSMCGSERHLRQGTRARDLRPANRTQRPCTQRHIPSRVPRPDGDIGQHQRLEFCRRSTRARARLAACVQAATDFHRTLPRVEFIQFSHRSMRAHARLSTGQPAETDPHQTLPRPNFRTGLHARVRDLRPAARAQQTPSRTQIHTPYLPRTTTPNPHEDRRPRCREETCTV